MKRLGVKLSAIDDNEIIIVENSRGTYQMTKREYLDSGEEGAIYRAKEVLTRFSWLDLMEMYRDDQYEGWDDDVMNEIYNNHHLCEAENIVNNIFLNHKTYYSTEEIKDDTYEN